MKITTSLRGDHVVEGGYRALPDPVQDMLLGLVLALGAEVWTLRDRLRLLETVLAGQGIPVDELLQQVAADSERVPAMQADRDAFIGRFLRSLTTSDATTAAGR